MLALQTAKMVSNGVSTSLAVALFVLLQSAALVSSVCPACMCPPNACDGGYASASVPNGIISVNYQFQVPDVPALDPNGNNPQFLFALGSDPSTIDGPSVVLVEMSDPSSPTTGAWSVYVTGLQSISVKPNDLVSVTLSSPNTGNGTWNVGVSASSGTHMNVSVPAGGNAMDVFYYSIVAPDTTIPCTEFPASDYFAWTNVVITDGTGSPIDWALAITVLAICNVEGAMSTSGPNTVSFTWAQD